ncbi:transporter [Lachnospiraceae bacterium 46-15]
MKKIGYEISAAAILLFLFLCPAQALAASRRGLHLWFDTLLPTLLPFMIFSNILIRADLVRPLVSVLSPVFHGLLRLSPGGTYALLMGFLCGCPMGAKTLADLRSRGQIALEEAQYLLGFCNNISPSFVMNFLVMEQLKAPELLVPSLIIIYGSPLLYGILTNPSYRRTCREQLSSDAVLCSLSSAPKEPLCFGMVDSCILDGVTTIVKLGCYVMLFAILAGIIQTLPLPVQGKALLTAFSEITNGIPAIIEGFSFPSRFLFLMVMVSCGGLSALAQTDSAAKNAHLSIGKYVRSKLITSLIALLLALCFLS